MVSAISIVALDGIGFLAALRCARYYAASRPSALLPRGAIHMLDRLRKPLMRRVLGAYKARKRRRADLSLDHALDVTRAMLERTAYCVLITNSSGPWPSARLVQPIMDEAEEFVLYFGTDPGLRKAREIEADPHVTVAIENKRENANLILYGTASLEHDLDTRRRRWMGAWRLFFPDGPTRDGYVVIRFVAERIELMNFSRNVTAEPFGLRPLVLVRDENGRWQLGPVGPAA